MLTLALALAFACPQHIDVAAPGPHSTTATFTASACGKTVFGPWRARVGYAGLSTRHREGDGTTPIGTFTLGPTAYGLDPDPGALLAYHRLRCGDWWDEDPGSPTYNSFRHLACGLQPPFHGGEALWRATVAYREFVVIRYNVAPTVAGHGSGIFLHDGTGRATSGCVSLPRAELLRVLRWLRPGGDITISA
jgi:L,D-peptidoglycan transpeptidase YkuD (ErfK/YbiS/YcfS/YnhG family)